MPGVVEALVCQLRREHPRWGPVRLGHELERRGIRPVPSQATLYRILVRNTLIIPGRRRRPRSSYLRWEREAPMALWQMDIMGGVFLADGTECKLVTGIDDHSRFVVIARLVARASSRAVCLALIEALGRFGVPEEMLTDNGKQFTGRFTKPRPAEVLFERVCREHGITAKLTKPYSPTTTGKVERWQCATRRTVVSPVQPGGTRREVPGSDGLPDAERLMGQEHARKPEAGPSVRDGALGDPRDMAKAGLPESQSPEDGSSHPPERRLKPAPALLDVCEIVGQPPGTGAMPSEGIQGDEWDA
jgi:transposase InsO family protein